jgi:hypothetical protein
VLFPIRLARNSRKDTKKCTTQQGSMDVTMPATALNPFPSVASVSYTYTICFDNNGNATISYRNVDAVPNIFPHPLFDHWSSLPSPTVEQAIDEYTINAANKVEDILTQQFFANYPNAQILESRYYRALCYTTCMFLKEGVATAARTTCGDKCCKRVRIWSKNPNGPALTQESFETNGGVCAGGTSSPCQNPIVVTSICSHECAPRFD